MASASRWKGGRTSAALVLWRQPRRISSEGSGTAPGITEGTGDGSPDGSNSAGLKTRHPDLSCLGGCNCLAAQALFCSRCVRQLGRPGPSALAEAFCSPIISWDLHCHSGGECSCEASEGQAVQVARLWSDKDEPLLKTSAVPRMCGRRIQHSAEGLERPPGSMWKSRPAVRAAASRRPRLPASRTGTQKGSQGRCESRLELATFVD